MEALQIEPTRSTPKISFDPENHKLHIEGQSYPENAFKFYEPVFDWVEKYLEKLETQAVFEIYLHMPYINTSSSKCLMMLLEKMDEAHKIGKQVRLKWYYDIENEMALECAEEFKEDLNLPFEIVPLENP